MKYATTALRGRLGNNMFQAGALYTYAQQHGYVPMVHNNVWGYPTVLRNVNVVDNSKVKSFKSIRHDHFEYKPIQVDKTNSSINISGSQCYFQHENYINKDIVTKLFAMPDSTRDIISKKYPDIEKRCSIHIRRGDYVGNIWPVYGMDYVNRAREKIESDKFMVFSDDITWCKKNFPSDMDIIFCQDDPETSLYAMSMCKHNIIANSSFSWWGAYLNENENKKVVAPSKWFYDTHPVVRSGKTHPDGRIQCKGWIIV